jgi:D-alanyl-D-alanine dipeptidase
VDACGGAGAASRSVEAPPAEIAPDATAESLLVDVRSVDSTIQVEARYAPPDNFTGARLPSYEAPRVMLRREIATALLAMVDWAERTGRRELVDSGYIARPSRHNQGVAVDLTLVDLETGAEIPMGTRHFGYQVEGAVPFARVIR